jgi:hypothetical protein
MPKIPQKKWIGNTNTAFVQKRCRKLQKFLNDLAQLKGIFERHEMLDFLTTSLVEGENIENAGSDDEQEDLITSKKRRSSDKEAELLENDDPNEMGIPVTALHDYRGETETELSFSKGDILTIVTRDHPDWWYGRDSKGNCGYFPKDYVCEFDQ